jgi:hypothetical protein
MLVDTGVAIFSDIEFVSIDESSHPDAFVVTFDVIYAGETWCRSTARVDHSMAALLGWERNEVTGAARAALLELLATELVPVSFDLRLTAEGAVVLARGVPGRRPSRPS